MGRQSRKAHAIPFSSHPPPPLPPSIAPAACTVYKTRVPIAVPRPAPACLPPPPHRNELAQALNFCVTTSTFLGTSYLELVWGPFCSSRKFNLRSPVGNPTSPYPTPPLPAYPTAPPRPQGRAFSGSQCPFGVKAVDPCAGAADRRREQFRGERAVGCGQGDRRANVPCGKISGRATGVLREPCVRVGKDLPEGFEGNQDQFVHDE